LNITVQNPAPEASAAPLTETAPPADANAASHTLVMKGTLTDISTTENDAGISEDKKEIGIDRFRHELIHITDIRESFYAISQLCTILAMGCAFVLYL
jgi:hypothetical protein